MGNKITFLVGPNFSGRTTYLRNLAGLEENSTSLASERCQYLGSEVSSFISGLHSTVKDEIKQWFKLDKSSGPEWLQAALEAFSLDDKLQQNPFTLSGGEQTLLAVLTVLLTDSKSIALDCALEQLSKDNRLKVLGLINRLEALSSVTIADNRISEYLPNSIQKQKCLKEQYKQDALHSDEYHPYRLNPITIDIEKLRFSYSEKTIFEGANISLDPSDIYFLVGENGAGKSTLSKLLCGILSPDGGSLKANGSEFTPSSSPAEVFAYHFQNPDLQLFSNTILSEIGLSAKNKSEENIGTILSAFGLTDYKDMHPMDLSFSLRKRLGLAVTFSMERPWVILDEPTIGQDDATIQELASLIKKQSEAGTGFLIVSHSSSFIELFDAKRLRVFDKQLALV